LGVTRGDQWMNDMFRRWAEMLLKLMRDFRAYWERGLKAIDKEGYATPSPEHARWPTSYRYTKAGPHGMAEGWRDADGETWDRVEKLLDGVAKGEFRPLSVPMAGEMLVPANKQGGNRLLLEKLMAAKVQRRVGDYLPEKEANLLRVNLANLLIGFDATELSEITHLDNIYSYIMSHNFRWESIVQSYLNPKVQLWACNGSLLLPSSMIGADGACMFFGNWAPDLCRKIIKNVKDKKFEEAQKIQKSIIDADFIGSTKGVAALKKGLNLLGYSTTKPRRPTRELDLKETEELKKSFIKAGII